MPNIPYGIIADCLKCGEVIPFLGAGASLSGRPTGAEWNETNAGFLPTGGELSRRLASKAAFPSQDSNDLNDLAKVSSYYTLEAGDRPKLVSFMHDKFNRDYEIGALHHFLADIEVPLLIVTTNYDDLIERAFKNKGKPYHLVVYPTDNPDWAASVLWFEPGATKPTPYAPKDLPLSLDMKTTIIYKMHGSVNRQAKEWDSFVITEEDYVDFLSRMTGQTAVPKSFMMDFRTRSFLFLGYGMRDWNLRVMLRNLRSAPTAVDHPTQTGGRDLQMNLKGWAIQRKSSESEFALEFALWKARGVNLYDIEIDEFVKNLAAELRS